MKQVWKSNPTTAAVHEGARVSGLSPTAIESLAEAGQLVAERVGRTVFFRLCGAGNRA